VVARNLLRDGESQTEAGMGGVLRTFGAIETVKNVASLLRRHAGSAVGHVHLRVRSLALMIACDGQPLLNLRVRKYLASQFSPHGAETWVKHWMELGLREYEAFLVRDAAAGRYSHGDSPTLADVCLVPQMLMAQRFNIPTTAYRRATRVFEACMELPEFAAVVGAAAVVSSG